MAKLCPVLTRFLIGAGIAASLGWAGAQAAAPELHMRPLSELSPSGEQRELDWRNGRAKAEFVLPANIEAESLRIILAANPGEPAPAPHGSIVVSLNGSPPAVLRPEAFPFTAQLDFPGRYLTGGRNEAVIAYRSPEGDCPNPTDGAWVLDLATSQAELRMAPAAPSSLGEMDALLRSEIIAPKRIAIDTANVADADRAALQVWTAIAVGIMAPATPEFVLDGDEADFRVAFDIDPAIREAWLRPVGGEGGAGLIVHAPNANAAVTKLRDYARVLPDRQEFATPIFDPSWSPETPHTQYRLDKRPESAVLRARVALSDAVSDTSSLTPILNGRELPPIPLRRGGEGFELELPAHLLQPGLNRLAFDAELNPAMGAQLCQSAPAQPLISLTNLRISTTPAGALEPGLFEIAAGVFGDHGAEIALPAANDDERRAQLALMTEIARRARRVPHITAVTGDIPDHAADRIIIASRTLLPEELLGAAPDSLRAVLRGGRDWPRVRYGRPAQAAGAAPVVKGGAARFQPDGPDGPAVTLITEAAGADFAPTINAVVEFGLLSEFDGRVMRWNDEEIAVQDRGAWVAPARKFFPPPSRGELERTALFLVMLLGISGGWVLSRKPATRKR